MIPPLDQLKSLLSRTVSRMDAQGHCMDGLREKLKNLPDSYDACFAFAKSLPATPMRATWVYEEPNDYAAIVNACEFKEEEEPPAPSKALRLLYSERARAACYGAVQGCILGKPLEVNPSYGELCDAGLRCGEWPIDDYISERFLSELGRRHMSSFETAREHICYAAADDDLNYLALGLCLLEEKGRSFTLDDVRRNWQRHIPINFVFGAERVVTAAMLQQNVFETDNLCDEPVREDSYYLRFSEVLNPSCEYCGAAIRTAVYGLACPGRPAEAACLAYTDAVFTHRKTGLYAAMYVAALTALLISGMPPLHACDAALCYIPKKSRLFERLKEALLIVRLSESFEAAYDRLHSRFSDYDHCTLYQELGTLMNSLYHAENVWHGVCLQVMQGNDTDSFGCMAGLMLGARFGMAGIDNKKLSPFSDTVHIALADFYETSIDALAARVAQLPNLP